MAERISSTRATHPRTLLAVSEPGRSVQRRVRLGRRPARVRVRRPVVVLLRLLEHFVAHGVHVLVLRLCRLRVLLVRPPRTVVGDLLGRRGFRHAAAVARFVGLDRRQRSPARRLGAPARTRCRCQAASSCAAAVLRAVPSCARQSVAARERSRLAIGSAATKRALSGRQCSERRGQERVRRMRTSRSSWSESWSRVRAGDDRAQTRARGDRSSVKRDFATFVRDVMLVCGAV